MIRLPDTIAFEWDEENRDKNRERHCVSVGAVEEVFFDSNKRAYPDPKHSLTEPRSIIVGRTKQGRLLFVVYTTRQNKIRVISARDLNKKREVDLYEKAP